MTTTDKVVANWPVQSEIFKAVQVDIDGTHYLHKIGIDLESIRRIKAKYPAWTITVEGKLI